MRTTFFSVSISAVSTLALLAGCSSSTPETTPPPDSDAGAPPPVVQWTPCPLHVEGTGPTVECATIQTPLDAKNPSGPTIDMFVKRYKPKGGKSLRAVWFLQGGPGASGYVFEGLSEQIATKFPDVDFYMPDHRGTGKSTRLGCAVQEASDSEGGIAITDAEWPACLADVKAREGSRLPFFNVTNAANDLGVMIARTQPEGQPVFVYGVSYGTYWAHRYLQLYPNQANGVVFDSIFPQGGSLARQDADANEAAKDFFAVCGKDTFCSGKLGTDPWPRVEALFAKLKSGHCSAIAIPEIPTYVLFRRAFGSLLMDPNLRGYIPAFVYRLDRCEPRDIDALKILVTNLTQEQPESEMIRQWSWIVTYNIMMSELWETPSPTAADLQLIRENAVASRDVTLGMELHIGNWPTYTPDNYSKTWATSTTPLLFLQGGLDPATLLRKAREVKSHFTGPNQHWVEIPTATHTVIGSSTTSEKRSCGTRIMMNFIENPTAALDTSCISTVVPIDFVGTRKEYNGALLGTSDAWE